MPETKLEGTGKAELFTDGRRIRARWTKDGVDSPIQLSKRGEPLAVPAGHTWIELVPADNGGVTFEP